MEKITNCQKEIFNRHIAGETEKSIALNMGISIYTVKYHKRKVYRIFEVNNLAAAIIKLKDKNII